MANLTRYSFLAQPRPIFALLGIISLGSLGFAFYLEMFQNLAPCVLCRYQRIPYIMVVIITIVGFLISTQPRYRDKMSFIAILCSLIFFIGSLLALFHLGVELKWWEGTNSCCVTGIEAKSTEMLKEAILNAPTANCSEVLWQFFGVSLAGWNFIWSSFLTVILGWIATVWIKGQSA